MVGIDPSNVKIGLTTGKGSIHNRKILSFGWYQRLKISGWVDSLVCCCMIDFQRAILIKSAIYEYLATEKTPHCLSLSLSVPHRQCDHF